MEQIKKGIYRHFKGGFYEVIDVARHSETLESMVIYRSLKDQSLFVRPLSMWHEQVIRNGQTYQRFIYIGENNESIDA